MFITRYGGRLRYPRYWRAMTYWVGVHEKGDNAFWSEKIRPLDRRKTFRTKARIKKIPEPKFKI
ncbi:hypothetical protein LCGC14_2659330 [marine sediment metagenome]|uniref:Uncharacterized protein n=1 Tax=marine sediment metagenome TaxID=412755 RepID=A0A0F9C2P9_9ZZZZ